MRFKALTLWQPWATLIAIGAKKVETRSWATNYRGPLVIHAAKRWTGEQYEIARKDGFHRVLAQASYYIGPSNWKARGQASGGLSLGSVVCMVDLLDVLPTDEVVVSDFERRFGDFGPGRFAWLLGGVKKAVRPVAMKGRQGLWNVDVPRGTFAGKLEKPG